MNILHVCLSYSSMKYDTSLFLVEELLGKKLDFICFSFLTSLAFIEVHVLAIATCAMCFTGKIFRVHKKCGNV